VETYGGGLWHTWFDRDLSLAGRVIVETSPGKFDQRLVNVRRPILKVPTLCIHLQSNDEREAFKVNKEDHLVPLLCGAVAEQMTGAGAPSASSPSASSPSASSPSASSPSASSPSAGSWAAGQEPVLVELLAAELGVAASAIADFELTLYDTQAAALGGARREFVNGARVDNLASCFVAVEALIGHAADAAADQDGRAFAGGLAADQDVSVIALFDHEEVRATTTELVASLSCPERRTNCHRYLSLAPASKQ
jgi:aspartyl aminopeptidase